MRAIFCIVEYKCHNTTGLLRDFVERFWSIRDTPDHRQERIVPSATIELVINLREDEFRIYDPARHGTCKRLSGAIVSGPYQSCFLIDARQHASVMGVHFKPGGAFMFFSASVNELADRHVDLEALWGTAAAKELRERLCSADNPEERFELLAQTLTARFLCRRERHYAVLQGLNSFGRTEESMTVKSVSESTGLSQRRFIDLFKREVGMTPKLFCRVRRFQDVLAFVRKSKTPDWSEAAYICGYFDQSHLIRDFRIFSGINPTDYALRRTNRVMENHVPVAG